jgi:hypothetical protein
MVETFFLEVVSKTSCEGRLFDMVIVWLTNKKHHRSWCVNLEVIMINSTLQTEDFTNYDVVSSVYTLMIYHKTSGIFPSFSRLTQFHYIQYRNKSKFFRTFFAQF